MLKAPGPGAFRHFCARSWPAPTVRLAVHALPPGPIRERYQQELLGLCRTHVHHKWRLERNPEGETYLRCGRCGNDRYDVERVDGPNMGGNLMGLHGGV